MVSSVIGDPVEAISRDEMAALQVERLRDCLARLVAQVPFYRESLGALDIAPEEEGSLGRLRLGIFGAELLRTDGQEPHYELLLERGESRMDDLTIRVEASEELYRDGDSADVTGRKLMMSLQSRLGVGCRVEVLPPKLLPRSEGKAVRVVDNRR